MQSAYPVGSCGANHDRDFCFVQLKEQQPLTQLRHQADVGIAMLFSLRRLDKKKS